MEVRPCVFGRRLKNDAQPDGFWFDWGKSVLPRLFIGDVLVACVADVVRLMLFHWWSLGRLSGGRGPVRASSRQESKVSIVPEATLQWKFDHVFGTELEKWRTTRWLLARLRRKLLGAIFHW